MIQIKFKKFGANTAIGGFAPGDVARVSDTLAAHFVESDVAAYWQPVKQPPQPVDETPPAAIETAPRTRKRKALPE